MASKSNAPASAPPPPPARIIPGGMKFVLGGLAGMGATCVVQPLDLVKTRMQLSGGGGSGQKYNSSFHCFQTVIAKEGVLTLYTGIGAGLLRQATYTTGRLGVYTYLNDLYKVQFNMEPNLLASMIMGMAAGACGAFIGTPAEVALIRMTGDGQLPPAQRRNYTSVVNALTRIVREEGLPTLWRGCIPTVSRAMVVNMAQLASYTQAKAYFKAQFQLKEGLQLHFYAAMLSGLLTTIVSMPVDIAKTRIQNMKYVDGKPEYRGTIDVLTKIARNEGVLALWKGFTPYFCRLGPHTVITFIILENLSKAYLNYKYGPAPGSPGA